MDTRIITTDNAPAPVGPYSQAVIAGQFVYCSGQLPIDPATGAMVTESIEKETARVMENLAAVLEAAGSSLARAVKMTIYVTDLGNFGRINEIYGTYFGDNPPARATVEVSGLAKGANVEIDCFAIMDD